MEESDAEFYARLGVLWKEDGDDDFDLDLDAPPAQPRMEPLTLPLPPESPPPPPLEPPPPTADRLDALCAKVEQQAEQISALQQTMVVLLRRVYGSDTGVFNAELRKFKNATNPEPEPPKPEPQPAPEPKRAKLEPQREYTAWSIGYFPKDDERGKHMAQLKQELDAERNKWLHVLSTHNFKYGRLPSVPWRDLKSQEAVDRVNTSTYEKYQVYVADEIRRIREFVKEHNQWRKNAGFSIYEPST